MQRSFTRLILAIALLGVGLFQAGCVKSTPTPEPVTISYAFSKTDTEYYQRMLQKFNEIYPYITVELKPKRSDLLGGIGAGDADTFVSSQFAQIWLKEQNQILDLTPFTEQDETLNSADFYPGAMGLYTSEGRTWGIPASVNLMVMFYNRDLFDQYNAAYPQVGWNWDDFLAAAMTIRDPETGTFGYMGHEGNSAVFDALTFIYQHGGRIFDDLQHPTATTFDDPLTIEALDWYADLMFKHNVAPTPEQVKEVWGSRGDFKRGVQLGRVGMWTGMLSERDQDWIADLQVGIAPLPVDQNSATMTLIEGYFISSKAKHPDACWTWISFLSQQMPMRAIPVRKSMVESSAFEDKIGGNIAAVARASMENALMLSPELAKFEDALDLFSQAFGAILEGRSTADEAMTWAQQESKFKATR